MKKGRGFLTIALFALAATLLSFSVVGSSRAALTYYSDTYGAEVSMYDIGVTLVENDIAVSNRDYSGADDIWNGDNGKLLDRIGNFQLGTPYPEVLTVRNSGNIDEYVRVTIYKYWATPVTATNGNVEWVRDGDKKTGLNPDLIGLRLANEGVWKEDESARTRERTVLYYTGQFPGYDPGVVPAGEETPEFADQLLIDDEPIEKEVSEETRTVTDQGTIITTKYDYNGMTFVLEVHVDAVQTHNAPDAIKSAWGVDMNETYWG